MICQREIISFSPHVISKYSMPVLHFKTCLNEHVLVSKLLILIVFFFLSLREVRLLDRDWQLMLIAIVL